MVTSTLRHFLHQLFMKAVFALVYPGSGRTKAKKIRTALSRPRISALAVIAREQTQIDRIRESFISGIRWVSMVSAIKSRKYPCGLTGITEDAIEIDHGIVFPAGADPRIKGLPLELIRGREDRERGSR